MQSKYFLLVLIVTYSLHIASTHMLTSAYVDMTLPACMRSLSHMMSSLCPTYGDYSSEYLPPLSQEEAILKQERTEIVLHECCTKPCTVLELMEMC